MIKKHKILFIALLLPITVSCNSSKESTTSSQEADGETIAGMIESGSYFLKKFESYSNGQLVDTFDYELDIESNVINRKKTNIEGNPIDIKYYFDMNGGLSKVEYISESEIDFTETMQRDAENRIEKILVDSLLGNEEITFTYSNGLLVERIAENGFVSAKTTYSYDVNSLLVELVSASDSIGENDSTSFTYNSNNQRISTQWDYLSDGSIDESTSIDYDENGNVSSMEYFADSGESFARDVFIYEKAAIKVPNIISFTLNFLP